MQNQNTPKPPADSDQTTDRVGVGRCDLFSSLFHPDDSDRGFLMWIHERLQHVHCDPDLADYMHRLRAIIADMPADRKTVSKGQGKNSLAALQEFIVENAKHIHPCQTPNDNDSQ
jgi:hypothetical protein